MNFWDFATAEIVCLLIVGLCILLGRQDAQLRRARGEVRHWRHLAGLNAETASLHDHEARMWRVRALHPDLRPFWDVIENAVSDDERRDA